MNFFQSDIEFLQQENAKRPVKPPLDRISEYIEGKRVLPPNTPFPGFWSNSKTPYSIEIMDNMAPMMPVQHTVVMKAAQLGLTAAAENVIAYWIDEYPSEILFISATIGLLENWAAKRVEPLIDSCGFREKLFSQIEGKQSKRTGDRLFRKEFVGGSLSMASAQAAAMLRSESKRVLIRDEIDGAPAELRTGEGNWIDVSFARTNAWGDRKKILDFSTPGVFGVSQIYELYARGDQRKYFVPCPYCDFYQHLEWTGNDAVHGLKGILKDGTLLDTFYVCIKCGEQIRNHHKNIMLIRGQWRPTAKSHSKTYRSYHINSLYSPVGMLSWNELYKEYLKAMDQPEGMRSFTNLYLGLPYRETGSRPKLEKVIELRGGYKSRTVPKGVLFLTAGVDVQTGSKRDPNNPARLEMEICGHGAGFRTFSICYERFEGDIDNFDEDSAWYKLDQFARETGLTFERADGVKFVVKLIFIDSGDGNTMDMVYRFSQGWQSTFPIKGFSALKKRKGEKGDDEVNSFNARRYRPAKVGEDILLYEISTNYYKQHLYKNLKIERRESDYQRAGFCDFPIDYGEKYFKGLTAEEKRIDGTFHCPAGRRNEPLDCRVYNQCAGDVYLDGQVLKWKAAAMERGATDEQLQGINHRFVLEQLTKRLEPV
jgi:phage terminase large subunit GpA-like protein